VEENWLPILDYAHVTGKSISTLRRYIKSAKVEYKLEDGKYFILYRGSLQKPELNQETRQEYNNFMIEEKLKAELREKEDEITELKMLVKLYEKKLHTREEPPALPVQ